MHVLIVSPIFPPFSGVGGLRMGSFARYLCDQGVGVHVVRNDPSLWSEQSLKSDVPTGIEITDVQADQDFNGNGKRYAEVIRRILDTQTIDVILYSVGPFFTLLALREIAKTYPHKQVIDFRDLWAYQQKATRGFVKQLKVFILKGYYRSIERPAVHHSDGIVVVTPGDYHTMSSKYPRMKHKIDIILNGYESVAIPPNQHLKTESTLQLVSLGKLGYYAPHLASALFNALSELKGEGLTTRLVHVGQPEESVDTIQTCYPEVDYQCTGYMEYKAGLQVAYESDIAVIVMNHPTAYGTKVFDYILCNKPIILITEDAKALSELVSSMKHGYVCTTAQEIKAAIQHIVNQHITTLDDQVVTQQYSRAKQNELYLELLRNALNNQK